MFDYRGKNYVIATHGESWSSKIFDNWKATNQSCTPQPSREKSNNSKVDVTSKPLDHVIRFSSQVIKASYPCIGISRW